jgi:AcrR family transcriptional regulator
MSGTVIHEPTRRALTDRQAEVVERLVRAAAEEVREQPDEGLSVRRVARRAGLAPATAYTYFGSKDHLVAEVAWRRLRALPDAGAEEGATRRERVRAELRTVGLFMADDPAMAAACTQALLSGSPDVKALRDRIGQEIHRRLRRALGPGGDPAVLRTLELAWIGALLTSGMGHLTPADVPARLLEVADLVVADEP